MLQFRKSFWVTAWKIIFRTFLILTSWMLSVLRKLAVLAKIIGLWNAQIRQIIRMKSYSRPGWNEFICLRSLKHSSKIWCLFWIIALTMHVPLRIFFDKAVWTSRKKYVSKEYFLHVFSKGRLMFVRSIFFLSILYHFFRIIELGLKLYCVKRWMISLKTWYAYEEIYFESFIFTVGLFYIEILVWARSSSYIDFLNAVTRIFGNS